MDRETFVMQYMAAFLGAYMANRYQEDCARGHEGDPHEHQPVEDAEFLANSAWRSICQMRGIDQ